MRDRLLTLLGSFLLASTALAQTAPPAPGGSVARPPAEPGPPSPELDEAGVQSLAQNQGIGVDEARKLVEVARALQPLSASLDPERLPSFAGAFLEPQPSPMLTILHIGSEAEIRAQLNIPAELSQHVQFAPAKVPLGKLLEEQRRFLGSLAIKTLAVATWVDQRNNRLVIQVEDGAAFEAIRAVTPGLVPAGAQLVVGPLPKLLAGAQPTTSYTPRAGDYIEGGRWLHEFSTVNGALQEQRTCTIGFGAKWGTVYGILTAGHCEPGNYGTGYFYAFGGRWIEMWGPDYESTNVTTKYDFQFHRTPGMKVYNTIAVFDATDTVTQWLYVNGTESRLSQWSGYPTCKYGRVTKLGCFTLKDNNYYFKNNAGYTTGPWAYVQASRSIATTGDSGGSAQSPADGGYVKARGIIHRGGYSSALGLYEMIYMPIDHIDDVHPISVLTAPSP